MFCLATVAKENCQATAKLGMVIWKALFVKDELYSDVLSVTKRFGIFLHKHVRIRAFLNRHQSKFSLIL